MNYTHSIRSLSLNANILLIGLLFLVSAEAKEKKAKQQEMLAFSTPAELGKPAKVPDWVGQRPPVEGDWVQTLDENFEGPVLDPKLWTPRQPYDIVLSSHIQRYLEENVTIENGVAVIKCEKRAGHQYNDPNLGTREYTTGCFTSYGKWTQLYGYMEARVQVPATKGLWACFWTMPDRGSDTGEKVRTSTSNGGMEVDILEQLTNWGPGRYNTGLHWDGYKDEHKQTHSDENYYGPTADGWHVFGLLWEPGKYTFYCDGVKMAEWANERVGSVPSFIICNVEMRGKSTKEIEFDKMPAFFKIDYVKAWQLQSRISDKTPPGLR